MSDKASDPLRETRQFLFLLGRPGSGKSHVFHKVAGLLPGASRRIDDFPRLQALADKDDAKEAQGKQRQFTKKADTDWLATQVAYETAKKVDSGWLATQVAYEKVLQEFDSQLRRVSRSAGFVFVEFARWDMVRSIEENFSAEVLNRSFLIYVYCPLSICIERNRARTRGVQTTVDQHEVPLDRLAQRYRDDDHDVLDQLGVPYVIIDNHQDGTEHLDLEAKKILQALGCA